MNQNGQEVQINIGQTSGVEIEQRFKVANEEVILEVIEVQQETCLAKIVTVERQLKIGQRIEAN